MRHLVIIGNGFDLAHGLKTSYKDFIKYIFDNVKDNPTEYKSLINIFTSYMDYEVATSLINDSQIGNHLKFNNSLFEKFFRKTIVENWSDVEELYFDELSKICKNYSNSKRNDLIKLNKEFENIIEHLNIYLSHIINQQSENKIKPFHEFFEKINNNTTLILNFNYSNTISFYLPKKDKQIIDIHGQLNSTENPIIFGFAVNQSDSEQFLNTGEREFTKYIKRYLYKNSNNEKKLRDFLDINGDISVTILGHSCGISDHLILNQIFTHEKVKSIRIMYFETKEEYLKQCFNIDRIVKDEGVFSKKIHDFTESHRLPQVDDGNNQHNNFYSFLETHYKERLPYTFI